MNTRIVKFGQINNSVFQSPTVIRTEFIDVLQILNNKAMASILFLRGLFYFLLRHAPPSPLPCPVPL